MTMTMSLACSTSARKRRSLAASCAWAAVGLRHVLDAMDEEPGLAPGTEHGGVDRAPVALLEPTSRGSGDLDVVLLDRHPVGSAAKARAFERRAQGAHPGGARVRGIVGEGLEHVPPDELPALSGRGSQVRVVDLADAQVRRQHETGRRHRRKQPAIVGELRLLARARPVVRRRRHRQAAEVQGSRSPTPGASARPRLTLSGGRRTWRRKPPDRRPHRLLRAMSETVVVRSAGLSVPGPWREMDKRLGASEPPPPGR